MASNPLPSRDPKTDELSAPNLGLNDDNLDGTFDDLREVESATKSKLRKIFGNFGYG